MYIESHTIITFVLPDEFHEADRFRETNDMTEWKESLSTTAVSFMLKRHYKVEYKNGKFRCGEETEDDNGRAEIH